MAVEILDETGRYKQRRRLARVLSALLAELRLRGRSLTVVLVDDETIAQNNRRDRGVDGPTDVLSYPTFEPDDVGFPLVAHLGDVLISLDTADRQAVESGHPLEHEVMILAAHGLTHLRGYDHTTEVLWRPFHQAQDRVLELDRTQNAQPGT